MVGITFAASEATSCRSCDPRHLRIPLGPLPCLLTNIQDKLLPLWAMPTVSMILTTDALTNIINPTVTVTGITTFSHGKEKEKENRWPKKRRTYRSCQDS